MKNLIIYLFTTNNAGKDWVMEKALPIFVCHSSCGWWDKAEKLLVDFITWTPQIRITIIYSFTTNNPVKDLEMDMTRNGSPKNYKPQLEILISEI